MLVSLSIGQFRLISLIVVFFLFVCGRMHKTYACGLTWQLPHSHFSGVDEQGHVLYSEKIGELDLGNSLKLPLFISFKSDREVISPYLGKGWEFSLLESRFVQLGENSFRLFQPDGWYRDFGRFNSSENILNGQGGWKAEINGDYITASAACGWKLAYYKGRILSITTPKTRKLEFIYSGKTVTEIRENGAAQLTIEQQGNGDVSAIRFNGKRIEIALDQKPRVENIAGQNVVAGIDQSLKSFSPAGGTTKSFEFSVNDKLQPTLKITSNLNTERLLTWDAVSKKIISDNDLKYNIELTAGAANAGIERINGKKQSEFWFYNANQGQEVIRGINGVKLIKSWFISGVTSGKIRKIEEIKNGHAETIVKNDYDEQGRLIRRVTRGAPSGSPAAQKSRNNGEVVTNIYYVGENGWDDNGKLQPLWPLVAKAIDKSSITVVKEIPSSKQFANDYIFLESSGRTVAKIKAGQDMVYYKYDDNVCRAYRNGILTKVESFYPNRKLKERTRFASDGKTISNKESYSYDPEAKTETVTTTELTSNANYTTKTITKQRDSLGRIIKYFNSQRGTFNYVYNDRGKRTHTFAPITKQPDNLKLN